MCGNVCWKLLVYKLLYSFTAWKGMAIDVVQQLETKNRGWIGGLHGWNSTLERRPRVWAAGRILFYCRHSLSTCEARTYTQVHTSLQTLTDKKIPVIFSWLGLPRVAWCYIRMWDMAYVTIWLLHSQVFKTRCIVSSSYRLEQERAKCT